MILRSPLKRMSSVAIGGDGNSLSFGKVRICFTTNPPLMASYLHSIADSSAAGSKVPQMLWQLNFS